MSYILEALKKAEAEREQGSVPGLRSQQAWSPSTAATTAEAWPAGRWLGLGLAVLTVCGFSLWLWLSSGSAEGSLGAKAPEERVAQAPSVPSMAASSARSQQPPAAPDPVTAAPTTVAPAPAKSKGVKPAAPASVASSSDSVVKWASLAASERQKLPKLQWGGAMYSPDPSARMVIINEQVMREGDALGAGLVVERIEAKSVILNLQGQRIRWDF